MDFEKEKEELKKYPPSGNADYPESLIWSPLGNYVRELLGTETSHEQ